MKRIQSINRVLSLLICLLVSFLVSGQLDDQTNTTNQDTNDTLSQSELARLNRYTKVSTQLSSVSVDPVVSFLQLSEGMTADLPLTSQSKLNQRTDLTVMFWFKVDRLPKAGEIMQIFSMQKTLGCFVDSQPSIQCNSVGIQSLRASSQQIIKGKWNHLTVSFKASSQTAYLILQDDNQELAYSFSKDASIIQNTGLWSACLGMCIQQRQGFVGGIREFIVRGSYILPEKTKFLKNEILSYTSDVKAYYRFQPDSQGFFTDQFVSRSFYWRSGAKNKTISDWRGLTMVPQNVCPQSFNYSQVLRFDLAQQMRLYQVSVPLKPYKYSYQMSLTFMSNSTSCYSTNIKNAINGCNLVLLEEVFMLYFQSPNVARFMFFATKNFYETQSPAFFLPNNQWVTVKLFMSQLGGYQIYIIDQNNNILTQFGKQYDMQEQSPKRNLYLFQSLVGYASKFYLSDDTVKTPNPNYVPKSPIVMFNFEATFSQDGQFSSDIANKGRIKQSGQLMFFPKADLVIDSTPQSQKREVFDGITCNDGHQVISLNQKNSFLNFSTPPLDFANNTQNQSVEFWFKLRDERSYSEQSQIFQLIDPYVDPFEHNYTYWVIYTNNSQLNVAPFGRANQNESAIISFSEFSKDTQDEFGWWHIACSFQFNVSIDCHLSNSVIKLSRGYYMINVVKAFPTYSLQAHFGYYKGEDYAPANVLLKDVRLWRKYLTETDVNLYKQMQIDPSLDPDILVYLKLNSFKNVFYNLAQLNQGNTFDCLGNYFEISQVSDMTPVQYTFYNDQTGLLEVRTKQKSHVVCPTYTYLKEESCYCQPINQVVLAIFPDWNEITGQLDWNFTIQYSSTIEDQIMQFLQLRWSTNDLLLNNQFQSNQLSFKISSSKFRQESIYEVSAAITNIAATFYMQDQVKFIPNSCQWFEVDGVGDAFSGHQEILEMPGESDLNFQLNLRQNPGLTCQQQSFFNSFQQISFSYYVSGSERRIGVSPKPTYTLKSDQSNAEPNTASDLKILVNIPASELQQLPTFSNIRILMNITWTSNEYEDILNQVGTVLFQHVLYTINYQTADGSQLTASLQPKSLAVAINQEVVLDASNVKTRNIDMQFVIIAYSWQCPTYFTSYCRDQSSSTLTLPWSLFSQSGAPYETNHQFQVTVALVRDGQVIYLATAQSEVVWFNIVKPMIDLDFRPRPILVSQPRDTFFTIVPLNFEKSQFQNFTIQWQVFGQLAGRQSISFQNLSQIMMVPSDSWKTNTTYNISCTLTYTKSSTIQTNYTYVVPVYGQPYGGLVYISPREGRLGDNFFIYLQGWESYIDTSSIFYTVFSTQDALGNVLGQQLTTRPMLQSETFFFKAQSLFPLVVKISDQSGEMTISRVVGFILSDNRLLSEQTSFLQNLNNLGSRHLSIPEIETEPLESLSCYPKIALFEVSQITKQLTCQQPEVIQIVRSFQSSSCMLSPAQKHQTIQDIYDILTTENSACRETNSLLLEVLDEILQTAAYEYDISVIQRLISNQGVDKDFHGKALQILQKQFSDQQEGQLQELQAGSVTLYQSQQFTLELSQFTSNAYFRLITAQSQEFSLALVQIYDQESLQVVPLSTLSGQLILSFKVQPELYFPNVTVCAVVALQTGNLSTESCLTQLNLTAFQITCTCNIMVAGEIITLTNDNSRMQGPSVQFPNHKVEVFASGISHIRASSYLFISIISSICLYGLIGLIASIRLDKRDEMNSLKECDSEQEQIVQKVSNILQRPQSLVRQQITQLKAYQSAEGTTVMHIAKAIHPTFAPFTYLNPEQPRSLRFCLYHFQVNILVIAQLIFFGRTYREGEHRFEEVLDLKDIQSVCYVMILASVLMVPLQPHKLTSYLGQTAKKLWRISVYIVSLALNLSVIGTAFWTAHQAPASNQYLIAWSVTGSLVGSVIFTNIVRVLFNSYSVSYPLSHLQSSIAQTVLAEIKCMRQMKTMLKHTSYQNKISEGPIEAIETEQALHSDDPVSIEATVEVSQTSLSRIDSNRKLDDAFTE